MQNVFEGFIEIFSVVPLDKRWLCDNYRTVRLSKCRGGNQRQCASRQLPTDIKRIRGKCGRKEYIKLILWFKVHFG